MRPENERISAEDSLAQLERLWGEQTIEWLKRISPPPYTAWVQMNQIGYSHTPEKNRLNFSLRGDNDYPDVAQIQVITSEVANFLTVDFSSRKKRSFSTQWAENTPDKSERQLRLRIYPHTHEPYLNFLNVGVLPFGQQNAEANTQFKCLPFKITAEPLQISVEMPVPSGDNYFSTAIPYSNEPLDKSADQINSSSEVAMVFKSNPKRYRTESDRREVFVSLHDLLSKSIGISQPDPNWYLVHGGNPWWTEPWEIILPAGLTFQGK